MNLNEISYIKKRIENAKKLMDYINFMKKYGYYILIRGNGKFGGIIFNKSYEYEVSSGKRKLVADVLYDGKIFKENLTIFDALKNDFVPVYYDFGDFVILTSKVNPEDDKSLMTWLPPSEALSIIEYKKYADQLEISLAEVQSRMENQAQALKLEEIRNDTLEQQVTTLKREIGILSEKVASMQELTISYQTKLEAYHSLLLGMREQVNQLVNTLINLSKEYGKEPYDATISILGKTEKIIDFMQQMVSIGEEKEVKEISEQIKELRGELKEAISKVSEIRPKEEAGIVIEDEKEAKEVKI